MSDIQNLRSHLENLEKGGKLHRITRPINKDTELLPLVRWQVRGLPESERCGFLFENVTDSRGRSFEATVAAGIYASSTEVYALGMGTGVDRHRPCLHQRGRFADPSGQLHETVRPASP